MEMPGKKIRRFACKGGCGQTITTAHRTQKYCSTCSKVAKRETRKNWRKIT